MREYFLNCIKFLTEGKNERKKREEKKREKRKEKKEKRKEKREKTFPVMVSKETMDFLPAYRSVLSSF